MSSAVHYTKEVAAEIEFSPKCGGKWVMKNPETLGLSMKNKLGEVVDYYNPSCHIKELSVLSTYSTAPMSVVIKTNLDQGSVVSNGSTDGLCIASPLHWCPVTREEQADPVAPDVPVSVVQVANLDPDSDLERTGNHCMIPRDSALFHVMMKWATRIKMSAPTEAPEGRVFVSFENAKTCINMAKAHVESHMKSIDFRKCPPTFSVHPVEYGPCHGKSDWESYCEAQMGRGSTQCAIKAISDQLATTYTVLVRFRVHLVMNRPC